MPSETERRLARSRMRPAARLIAMDSRCSLGVHCTVHRILVVGPDTERKERLLSSLKDAGFVADSSLDGEPAHGAPHWRLVLVLGDASAVQRLTRHGVPVVVVPDEVSPLTVLALAVRLSDRSRG